MTKPLTERLPEWLIDHSFGREPHVQARLSEAASLLVSQAKALEEARQIVQAFLDCPEVSDCNEDCKDPETSGLERRARSFLNDA